jgi:hypothetical protein
MTIGLVNVAQLVLANPLVGISVTIALVDRRTGDNSRRRVPTQNDPQQPSVRLGRFVTMPFLLLCGA